MANTISGRFGSVQRILPTGFTTDGKPIWTGQSSAYNWVIDQYSNRWDKAAVPTKSGLEPASDPNYSNTVSAIQSWTLDNNTQTQSYAASNTRGFQAKFAGIRSCSGTIAGVGAFPPINPGTRFLFRGFVGPESGNYITTENGNEQFDVAGHVYQIAAVANSVTINIDYGQYAPITWQVQWQSDFHSAGDELLAFGIPTDQATSLGFYDVTSPPCDSVIPSTTCMLRIGETRNIARNNPLSLCLQQANLTFNTNTQSIANSCSAAAGGWQTMLVGTTDVTIAATIHGSNYGLMHPQATLDNASDNLQARSKLHLPGNDRYVRIYTGNNDICAKNGAWEFNKMFVGSYTGLNVDLASGNVLSFSTNLEFNAFPRLDNGICEKGYIKYRLPDSSRGTGIEEDDWATDTNSKGWNTFLDLTTEAA